MKSNILKVSIPAAGLAALAMRAALYATGFDGRGLLIANHWARIGLLVLTGLVAVALVGVRLIGLQVYTVLSGSMEPVYHVGSLIYVKDTDYRELEVGDDITFMLNETTIVTHRIVEILPDTEDPTVLRFRTQGIANKTADEVPVHFKNVLGKPVFTIPYLGYVAYYIQNPPGTYIAIAAGAILILLSCIPDLLKKEDEDNENSLMK